MSAVRDLGELIVANAIRVERGTNDSIDVGFFAIKLAEDSDLTALKLKNAIVRAEAGEFQPMTLEDLSIPEGVSYTTLGVWLGDQGLALALIGLGRLMDLWEVILPTDVGIHDGLLAQQMMGMGFVQLRVGTDSILQK